MSGPDLQQRRTVRWVVGLFAAVVLLQRFAVPGLPVVALVLPLVLAWCACAYVFGVMEIHRERLILWLAAAGATAAVITAQYAVTDDPIISPTSWALFVVTWVPFTLRLVDRRSATFLAMLSGVVVVSMLLAAACLAMTVSQLLGIAYSDWLASVVPSNLLLQDFVITYPIRYDSDLYRANAWIGLEPSIVSMQLGLGLLAALLQGRRPYVLALLAAGLVCTGAGSGFAIVLVGILVMLFHPIRQTLRRYAVAGGVIVAATLMTSLGQGILSRATEGSSARSSTNLRAVMPYEFLWPQWADRMLVVLLGRGPGSSQQLVEETGILGLLVPTPIKIFFDYGLVAGLLLAAFLLFCYYGGPSRSIAVSLLVSLWLLQPGTTTMIVVVPVAILVTWWSPRAGPSLESYADPRSAVSRRPSLSAQSRSRPTGVPI